MYRHYTRISNISRYTIISPDRPSNTSPLPVAVLRPQNSLECIMDMSAGAEIGKLVNGLKVPMLAVQSLDDPILTSEGTPTQACVLDKVEDLFVLLTK